MTNNNKSKLTFPIGYHDFHKDQTFNFQLNRWYSMGYARFEDMVKAGQRIDSFEEWKIEMLKLADVAVSEGRLANAAFYYRAAEFFTTREDPDKELLYDRFIDCFYGVIQDDEISKVEIPYDSAFLPAMQIRPSDREKRDLSFGCPSSSNPAYPHKTPHPGFSIHWVFWLPEPNYPPPFSNKRDFFGRLPPQQTHDCRPSLKRSCKLR